MQIGNPAEISIHLEDARASNVARAVLEVDQLLRRMVAALAQGRGQTTDELAALLIDRWERAVEEPVAAKGEPQPRLPRPVNPERGGFSVSEASGESLDIIGGIYGEAEHWLNSDPVRALTALITFLTFGRGIWRFFVRSSRAPTEEIAVEHPSDLLPILEAAIKDNREIDFRAREQSSVWRGRTKEIRIKIRGGARSE